MERQMQLPLKALRKKRNVTQKELADAIHVSFQTISKWENGITMPDISYLPLLARYFEVEVEILLGMKPLIDEEPSQKYVKKQYWDAELNCMKDWKSFYFNDDYMEFLVTKVWKIEKAIKILDCACGFGYLAKQILPYLPKGSTYTGIDISDVFIAEGRKIFQKNPQVRFIQADILTYEIQEKYDMVISQIFLSYVANPEMLLKKMQGALRQGGRLVAIDTNIALAEETVFLAEGNKSMEMDIPNPQKVWEFSEKKGVMNYHMGKQLPFLLKKVGFQQINARVSDCAFVYDGSDPNHESEAIVKYQNVLEHLERMEKGYSYYMENGCSWIDAEKFVSFQDKVIQLLQNPEVFVSQANCLFIVWGTKQQT